MGTLTTTGIKEEEVRNTSDNATIEDKFTTSTTTEEEEEGRTTIENESYTTSTTKEASNTATCITIDVESSTSTITIFNTNIESPSITTDTTDTNSINKTHRISDTITATTPLIATLPTKSRPTDTTDTNKVIKTPILSTTTSNNYYDNIDNEILRTEYEGTIVFDDSPALTTVCTDIPNDSIINELSITEKVDTIAGLLNEGTLEFVYGMLLEIPYDDYIREITCERIMEALSSQDEVAVDGAEFCADLCAFLDIDKQKQQQIDTTTANILPIATPPRNTKS